MSLRSIATIAFAAATALTLSACSGSSAADDKPLGSQENPVQLGVVGASNPYWDTFEKAAEKEGVYVDIVDFTDYNQPNPAVAAGELDMNQFQHIIYLANYNVQSGKSLVPIGATAIYPLGLYSTKYTSVADIPDGSQVAVPDDPTNQARGLLVLQQAGLISFTGGGSPFSTIDDVDKDASRVKVLSLDAAVTASSLPDVAAAIVNNDFIVDAGLDAQAPLAQDDPEDSTAIPYINIFATTAEKADNEALNKLVKIYQDDKAVQDGVIENSGDTAVMVKTPREDLEKSLASVEDDIRANQ